MKHRFERALEYACKITRRQMPPEFADAVLSYLKKPDYTQHADKIASYLYHLKKDQLINASDLSQRLGIATKSVTAALSRYNDESSVVARLGPMYNLFVYAKKRPTQKVSLENTEKILEEWISQYTIFESPPNRDRYSSDSEKVELTSQARQELFADMRASIANTVGFWKHPKLLGLGPLYTLRRRPTKYFNRRVELHDLCSSERNLHFIQNSGNNLFARTKTLVDLYNRKLVKSIFDDLGKEQKCGVNQVVLNPNAHHILQGKL
jgi:hypothetical protein